MGTATQRLILASGSPARRTLMDRLGIPYEVIPAAIDEPLQAGTGDARSYVAEIAWRKAAAVASKIDAGIIIAADTVGWLDGKPVLKPDDEADARRLLTSLQGRDHELWTGVVLWRRPDDLQVVWQELSRVSMKALTQQEIDDYLKTRQWVGCSGAYAIKEEGDPLLTVQGSITNVIGLPMETLRDRLRLLLMN